MTMIKARNSYQSHNSKSNRWWVISHYATRYPGQLGIYIAGSCYLRIRELTDIVYVWEQQQREQQQQHQQGKNIHNNGVAKAQLDGGSGDGIECPDLAELQK
jgi:hypothetical protein